MQGHRSSDSDTEVKIRVDNRIRVEWLIGGLLAALIACFGWAYASTRAQWETSRDMLQIKTDISEIKANGKSQLDQSTQAAMKNVELAGRLSALEGRVNIIESVRPAPRP